jgi:predicted nucleic acid-binding protein
MRTAIDTNVFSALWNSEPTASQMGVLLGQSRNLDGVVICAAMYAELLVHPKATKAFVDGFLAAADGAVDFSIQEPVWLEATGGFVAHAERRRISGTMQAKRLLVDFVIGAHASLQADRLLTLDPTRYEKDFSSLTLLP